MLILKIEDGCLHFEEGDEELLKYTVDYIAFSYYRSNTVKTGEFDYERPAHECVNGKTN